MAPRSCATAVEQGLHGAEAAADPEAHGDGGIQVTAGDVSDGGDHDADGEAVGQCEAEDGDAALTGGAQILVGAEGACGEENHGEGAEEFSEQFLGQAVQTVLPRKNAARCACNEVHCAARDSTELREIGQKTGAPRKPELTQSAKRFWRRTKRR